MKRKRNLAQRKNEAVVPEDEVIGLLDELARLIKELAPHLDQILSDEITPAQRHSFRDHAGEARVFHLSNDCYWFNQRMNAICSETARTLAFKKHGLRSGETIEDVRSRERRDVAKVK